MSHETSRVGSDRSTRWRVAGSYFEVCNCDAVCPCRRQGDTPGGRSTYGVCDFALSWMVLRGQWDGIDLSGRTVVMAGSYRDGNGLEHSTPWRVTLYVDEHASAAEHECLAAIFLGRAGGTTLRNFAAAIGEVQAVRSAAIHLDHSPNRESMEAVGYVRAATRSAVTSDAPIACGIPGYDHPGTEVVAEEFAVNDGQLHWTVRGRCGFATDFDYSSDD